MVGMEENPYKAPSDDALVAGQKRIGFGRCLTVICIVPCLVIAAVCLFAIGLDLALIALVSGIDFTWMHLAWWTLYLLNAATWAATSWAIWANRSRAVIAALLADVAALMLGYLG